MTTESLIVKLQGDTSSLDKSLSATTKGLDAVDKSVSGVDSGLKTMTDTSKVAVTSISNLTSKSKDLNGTITKLSSSLLDARDASRKSAEAVDKLSKELNAAKESGSATAEEIQSLEESLSEARSELTANRKVTNELNGELKDAKSEYSSVQVEIRATARDLGKLNDESEDSSSIFDSISSSANSAGNAISIISKSAIAAATSLTTMITLAAKGEQELRVFAKTARTTTDDFESLAFAAKSVGLDANGVADAMNDVNERLAEFSVGDGAGAFDDFAMAMGLSKDEAKSVADELKGLSGEDALRDLVNQMELAGTSTADMNFVLKSLSNDLAYASVLFEDNGKELDKLKSLYSEVNKELDITQQEAEGLNDAALSFDLMVSSLGNGATVISAQLAPALNEFFNSIIEVVPTATNTIVDFINKFREAANIDNISSINRELEELTQNASDYQEQINAMIGGEYVSTDFNDDLEAQAKGLSIVNERIAELIEQRDKLQNTQGQVEQPSGGFIGGSIGASSESSSSNDELQALLDRFKSEEQLLLEKYEAERVIAAGNNELLLELEREYLENSQLLKDEAAAKDQARLDEQTSYYADILKQQGKIDAENIKGIEDGNKDKEKSDNDYLGAAQVISGKLLEDSKAAQYANTVVNTASAAMRAYSDLGPIAGAAAAAAISAAGIASLADISSASKGSGSVSSSSFVTVEEEVPQLEAQSSDTDGSNQTVVIKFDDSTELGVAFNNAIERSRQDGLI